MEARALRLTIPGELAGSVCRTTTLETQLCDAQLVLEKLRAASSNTEAVLWIQVAAVNETFNVERARVESF